MSNSNDDLTSEQKISKEAFDKIKAVADQLGEHFDSVHIFATHHDLGGAGGTVNAQYGVGNWFARLGQIKTWIIKEDEHSRIQCLKESDKDDEK